MLVGTRYQAALVEKRACDYFQRSKAGIKAVFNVTAMERSILAELFERGGRGQLSGLRDRRPIERLVNKGFVERHTLNSQQEEYAGGGANGAPGARGSSCRLVGHDANHWRDFRYPWPAAAAGARGACRLRSHHPCRRCWQPWRTCEARRAGAVPRRARKRRSRRLEREPTCDAPNRDRWLPHLRATHSGRA